MSIHKPNTEPHFHVYFFQLTLSTLCLAFSRSGDQLPDIKFCLAAIVVLILLNMSGIYFYTMGYSISQARNSLKITEIIYNALGFLAFMIISGLLARNQKTNFGYMSAALTMSNGNVGSYLFGLLSSVFNLVNFSN